MGFLYFQPKFSFLLKYLNFQSIHFRRNLRQKFLLLGLFFVWIYFILTWSTVSIQEKIILKNWNVFVIKSFLYERSKRFVIWQTMDDVVENEKRSSLSRTPSNWKTDLKQFFKIVWTSKKNFFRTTQLDI